MNIVFDGVYKGHRALIVNTFENNNDLLIAYVELPKSNKLHGVTDLSNYPKDGVLRRVSFAGELPGEKGFFISNASQIIPEYADKVDLTFLVTECEELIEYLIDNNGNVAGGA